MVYTSVSVWIKTDTNMQKYDNNNFYFTANSQREIYEKVNTSIKQQQIVSDCTKAEW